MRCRQGQDRRRDTGRDSDRAMDEDRARTETGRHVPNIT